MDGKEVDGKDKKSGEGMKEERKKDGRNRRRIKLASGKMSLMWCILVRHKTFS